MIILDSPITMGRRRRPQATHFFIETRGRRPQAAGSRHRKLDHHRIRPQAAGHRISHLGSGLQDPRQIKKQVPQRGCKQEKNYLFNYHLKVYSKISPFLDRNEKKWLASFI